MGERDESKPIRANWLGRELGTSEEVLARMKREISARGEEAVVADLKTHSLRVKSLRSRRG